jgi:hypothetical protein
MSEEWSAPDVQGIKVLNLDVGAKRTMRGKRRLRSVLEVTSSLGVLAEEQKELIRSWIKGASSRKKWKGLLATSGFTSVLLAEELLKLLLEAGWVEIEEHRTSGRWEPVWVDFLAYEELREHLGLSNRDKDKDQADGLHDDFSIEALQIAAAQLDSLPTSAKIKRHELLCGLERWISDGLQGTRRDFSLFVRGRTKDVTSAEWDWLESQVDLSSYGVAAHTPMIRIKIPGCLRFPEGEIDFRMLPGAVALSMDQLIRVTEFSGEISCWKVLENLTSFEHVVASSGETEGVIWVPGFAPSWWVRAITNLVLVTKSPGKIACDPDPAGLLIASQVGRIWESQNVEWDPWYMDPKDFEGKGVFLPLTEHDFGLLRTFNQRTKNHPELCVLAEWLAEGKLKLEQESFVS